MLFLLLTFEDDHGDIRVLFSLCQLLFNLAHELHIYVDIFVWLQLALHWCDRKHLLSLSLFHAEIKADWVLALIFEVERKLFWFTHSDCTEVKFGRHSLIQ